MTDIIGMIRLFFYALTHPIATYRLIKDMFNLIRVVSLDVFGNIAPIYRKSLEGEM